MVAGDPLAPTTTATTVRNHGGKRQVQDVPFAETKEQLGGYYMIKAESMEAAQSWAAQCPGALWGKVEIRLVRG